MDLQTFITETLVQIVKGVGDAQLSLNELGTNARLNPALVSETASNKSGAPSPVEFDVALTITEEQRDSADEKIGGKASFLSVVSLQAAAEIGERREGTTKNETVSRVRFIVQLAQPADVAVYADYHNRVPSSRTGFNR